MTAPFLVAALVVLIAGVAKLLRPDAAASALIRGRLPAGRGVIRGFAAFEIGLGTWAIIRPGQVVAAILCAIFVLFTGLSALLAQRASSCGCFGADDSPATMVQPLLSAVFAVAAAGAVAWPPHGLAWLAHRSPGLALALAVGLAGAAYAAVLTYTALPTAWRAWEQA